ncbi:DNA repair protein RecO [Candidatus Saccharibacteria bacterium]|nr:DNA repair protein RecO [Candidatus Saccharibacteria bacterium]
MNGPNNLKSKDLKTEALVLKRTNFGETDRVLSILTPEGKKSVLAKGVRKERSRLAGGIEMFCLSDVVLHFGRGELAVLTSARQKKFYKNLLTDIESLELASEILKRVSKAAEHTDSPEFFKILNACLAALDLGKNSETVLTWFYFNLAKSMGEQINLFYDGDGEKLEAGTKYNWDSMEKCLKKNPAGAISANEIKLMRLMMASDLALVLKVKDTEEMMPELLYIAKTLNQI